MGMESDLNINNTEQGTDKKNLKDKKSKGEMKGKIVHAFNDGTVGFFDSTADLTKALVEERENSD